MKIKSLVLVAAAVISMATMNAHALTITAQGTILGGYDNTGVFGTFNADLSGLAFTHTITVSTETAEWGDHVIDAESGYQAVYGYGPTFTNTVTVNGYTVTFNNVIIEEGIQEIGNGLSDRNINNEKDYIFSSQYGYTEDSDFLFAEIYVSSESTPFVPTLSFDQTIFKNLGSSFSSYAYFYIFGSQDASFYGTPHSIMVNVPEPAPLALLGLGALGLIASRRRLAKNKNA